jgi:Xaa-Pro aminopeptidase
MFKAHYFRFSLFFALTAPVVIILLLAGPTPVTQGESPAAPPAIWQVAPPSPEVPEAERLAELRRRREATLKKLSPESVMVLFSAEPRIYTNDVDYHYRQENNLYYLTGIRQNGAVLVLIPGARRTREILFMPPRDPRYETWNGRMLSLEEARAQSGISEVWDAGQLTGLLAWLMPPAAPAFAARSPLQTPDEKRAAAWQDDFAAVRQAVQADQVQLYLLTPPGRDLREYRQEHELAGRLATTAPKIKVLSGHPIFAELRLVSEAFHRVFAMARPGLYEYEVQAEFEYTFRRRNADNWGYPCIVGAGENATTLHYITSQDRLADESLILMDCAAEYDHYTADITRTIPINGRFTPAQAEIYQIVYDAQMASIKRIRPGNLVGSVMDPKTATNSVQGVTAEVIKEGLYRLGLITSKDNNEFRIWYMHGSSHWIGMNVHDVGSYRTPLAPGMVLTVEPGIYIRPDALDVLPKTPENERFIAAVRPAFEKYKGIGVRIEDDILVTEGEPKVMSARIPSRLDEVEATIARLNQELRRSGWPTSTARVR